MDELKFGVHKSYILPFREKAWKVGVFDRLVVHSSIV
jgi:hypothetical protein